MRSNITPRVVALLCRISRVAQARAAGMTTRHLRRMTKASRWDDWRVSHAMGWCTACGFDFFDLKLSPEVAGSVKWDSGDPVVMDALRDIYAGVFPGVRPTRQRLIRCGAWLISEYKSACGPQG